MAKTVSIRMDEENYAFLHKLARDEKGDLSKAVREVVYKGRVMLAIDKYDRSKICLNRISPKAYKLIFLKLISQEFKKNLTCFKLIPKFCNMRFLK